MSTENEMMEVIDYVENEDGSANITFDMPEEVVNIFILQGLREVMKDEPVVVMPIDEYEEIKDYIKEPRQVELEPQMAQGLLELGITKAIKTGIENVTESN